MYSRVDYNNWIMGTWYSQYAGGTEKWVHTLENVCTILHSSFSWWDAIPEGLTKLIHLSSGCSRQLDYELLVHAANRLCSIPAREGCWRTSSWIPDGDMCRDTRSRWWLLHVVKFVRNELLASRSLGYSSGGFRNKSLCASWCTHTPSQLRELLAFSQFVWGFRGFKIDFAPPSPTEITNPADSLSLTDIYYR